MADVGIFPQLVGQGWSVKKTPTWQTRIQRAVSGRELRLLDYPYPLWQFELKFDALGDNRGLPVGTPPGISPRLAPITTSIGQLLATDLRTLMGFFLACQGAFGTFLYQDPTDFFVAGQPLGVGDGVSTSLQLVRTFGVPGVANFAEPMTAISAVYNLYFNGIRQGQGADWQVDLSTGLVTFAPAPKKGYIITADFSYLFRCRFMADAYQFDNFMAQLWQLQKLDFISVRP